MDEAQPQSLSGENRRELYEKLRGVWDLGANVIVGWRVEAGDLTVFYLPILLLPLAAKQFSGLLSRNNRAIDEAHLNELAKAGCKSSLIPMSFALGQDEATGHQIGSIIRYYTVTHMNCRAVALFDMVDFSLSSSFVEISQINVLSYHINRAAECVATLGLPVDLTTSTTGDGFYIWNRNEGLEADLALFYVTALTLVYNRVTILDLPLEPIPDLRCCFDFGEHYEYYQPSGTKPDSRGYIVGDVTIKLARLITAALPKQFLVGDSIRPAGVAEVSSQQPVQFSRLNMASFFHFAQTNARLLTGVAVGDGAIDSVETHLTGDHMSNEEFRINKYVVVDKHNLSHRCFNAQFVARDTLGRRIDVGLSNESVVDFAAQRVLNEDIQIKAV